MDEEKDYIQDGHEPTPEFTKRLRVTYYVLVIVLLIISAFPLLLYIK